MTDQTPDQVVFDLRSADRSTARWAGVWYLLMAVSGPIGILWAPSVLLVPGDPAATAANLHAHELVLRIGVAGSLVCQVSFVLLAAALARLFDGVDRGAVRLLLAFVIAAVPIAVVNELLPLGALVIAHGGLPEPARDELASAALALHQEGVAVVSLFWGLWLLPFARLVWRCGFIPRFLGVLLAIGGASYVIDASLAILMPAAHLVASPLLGLPLAAGELSMVVWLLGWGVRPRGTAPVHG